jgi:hypothetical protein
LPAVQCENLTSEEAYYGPSIQSPNLLRTIAEEGSLVDDPDGQQKYHSSNKKHSGSSTHDFLREEEKQVDDESEDIDEYGRG